MESLVNEIIKLNIDEIDSFNFPIYELIGIEVMYNNIKFEFIAHFTENPNLICFGAGRRPTNKTDEKKLIEPPYFPRWSWYREFDENFIAYSDPMFYLDEEMSIGWYVGDKTDWYLEIISKIIEKISSNRKISNNNILFFGSSGGGFSSVALATFIRNSHALINNTQFDIMNFNSSDVNKLFEILHHFFNGYSDEEIFNEIKYRLSNIELFKKLNYVPDITYYVNANSSLDISKQCMPFINDLLKLNFFEDNFQVHFYHDDNGHHPMDKFKTIDVIKNFSNEFLYNDYDEYYTVTAKSGDYGEDLIVDINLPVAVDCQADVKIGDVVKSVDLKRGLGSVNFCGLAAGLHEVSISYGDEKYLKYDVKLMTKINRVIPQMQVIICDNGDSLGVNVKLPGDVSRRAIVAIGDDSKLVSLKDGEGFTEFNGLKSRSLEVNVSYNGDTNYKPVSITKNVVL